MNNDIGQIVHFEYSEAALRINILTRFSYTLETIIQAGKMGLNIASVPIDTNAPTRPSRLGKSMFTFMKAQAGTILRVYAFYEPLRLCRSHPLSRQWRL